MAIGRLWSLCYIVIGTLAVEHLIARLVSQKGRLDCTGWSTVSRYSPLQFKLVSRYVRGKVSKIIAKLPVLVSKLTENSENTNAASVILWPLIIPAASNYGVFPLEENRNIAQ